MLSEDDSGRKSFKELCCSLLAIIIGFAACSAMSVLLYFTYETIIGKISHCTLWTDIPGRLAIFLTFYYGAAVCGIFPIPERFRINRLPQPFILYKLESWKRLFRNLRLLVCCFNCHARENGTDTETSPLRDGSNERFYDPLPISRRQSDRIQITNADASQKFRGRIIKTERKKDVDIANASVKGSMSVDSPIANASVEGSISFDSPIGGFIVPRVRGKATKPRYLSESSTFESSGESGNTSSTVVSETETLQNEERTIAKLGSENSTTPDVEATVPSFPRIPWGLLKYRSGVPEEAKALHKMNLIMEKRELAKQNKKQKVEESSEHSWKTDSDEYNPFTNRPLRLPILPKKSKSGFRGRTKTTPGSIRKLDKMNASTHKRTISITAPHVIRSEATNVNLEPEVGFDKTDKDQCCGDSTVLQSEVDRIQNTLRPGASFEASDIEASRQDNVLSRENESDEISVQIESSKAEPRLQED